MTPVFLHLGLHKTGTTSLQRHLNEHREVLAPHCDILLPQDLQDVFHCAMQFERDPDQGTLTVLSEVFTELLKSRDLTNRGLIMSCENMLGAMPRGIGLPYPHAVALINCYGRVITKAIPDAKLKIFISIRVANSWTRSLYLHHLRRIDGVRIDQNEADFMAKFGDFRPPLMVAGWQSALPHLDIEARYVGDQNCSEYQLAQAPYDFIQIPNKIRQDIGKPGHVHRAPPAEIIAELLELNRSDLDEDALIQAKKKVLSRWGKQRRAEEAT